MTRFLFPAVFLLTLLLAAFRSPGGKDHTKIDTLTFYDVSTSMSTVKGKPVYKVSGKVVGKAEYDKYASAWDNISKCTPCYLQHYSEDGKLTGEGLQYTDCRIGAWKEYYPDGKLKLSGHYRENPTNNWRNLYDRGYCSVKEGQWIYLSPSGDTTATEQYEKGKLVPAK